MSKFKGLYCRTAVSNLAQVLANSNCSPVVVPPEESQGSAELVFQEAPLATLVVIWDVYLNHARPGKQPAYVGTVRMEFGHHIDIQSDLKSLYGIEATLHNCWLNLPWSNMPETAQELPAWCMAAG